MKIAWIDVETTGIDTKTSQIIELACLFNCNGDWHEFHQFCKPKSKPENYDDVAKKSHNIPWSFLEENGVTQIGLYGNFLNFLAALIDKYEKSDKAIFAGYNSKFDSNHVRELFMRLKDYFFGSFFHSMPLDVASTFMAAMDLGLVEKQKDIKLGTVCGYLGIKLENAHSAIEDIKATKEAHYKCIEIIQSGVKHEQEKSVDKTVEDQ